jgi:hypothetical protein
VRNKLAQAMVKMKYGGNNWTPDEQAAIQGAITPGPGEGFLRNFGKLDPNAHGGAALMELPITGLVGAETGLPGLASAGATIGGAMAARLRWSRTASIVRGRQSLTAAQRSQLTMSRPPLRRQACGATSWRGRWLVVQPGKVFSPASRHRRSASMSLLLRRDYRRNSFALVLNTAPGAPIGFDWSAAVR